MRFLVEVVVAAGLVFTTVVAQQRGSQASVTFANGVTVRLDIADTESIRARGLLFRRTVLR